MKNNKILIPIIIILVIIFINSQAIIDYVVVDHTQPNTTQNYNLVFFEGYRMEFRAPIKSAEEIQVYPDEQSLKNVFLNQNLEEVKIVIISNNSANGNYILVSHALAVDLPLIIEKKTGIKPEIKAQGVNSIQEAKDISSPAKPVIMLLHPSMSNRTAITVENNVVFLEGESFELVNNDYFDLDLVAGKLMLTLMEDYMIKEQ